MLNVRRKYVELHYKSLNLRNVNTFQKNLRTLCWRKFQRFFWEMKHFVEFKKTDFMQATQDIVAHTLSQKKNFLQFANRELKVKKIICICTDELSSNIDAHGLKIQVVGLGGFWPFSWGSLGFERGRRVSLFRVFNYISIN